MSRATTLAAICTLGVALPAPAAPPAPAGPASGAIALHSGDSVSFDLSLLPERFEGEARAACLGTRFSGVGPVEARCERTFRFEVSAAEAKMVFVFRGAPAAGGRERRVELPITRDRKPVVFVAPSDGTLRQPEPTVFPADAAEKAARSLAEKQCGSCKGEGFRLEAVEVTRPPIPPGGDLPVRIGITSTAPQAPPPR